MLTIGDTWGFSGIASITLSRDSSVEILTGVTLLWKTKLNRSQLSTVIWRFIINRMYLWESQR